MAFTPSLAHTFLLLTVLVILVPVETYAFGAGDIPDFAYLNDKAFRHGDIENVLENLVKSAGGAAIGGSSILGFASSVIKHVAGGSKFSKSDIKKVYFGNWLRDYSQAMDIAGLSKLSADTLVLVVSVLGFMTFGFSTQEFEVTADRLGVYLPVEHIDNPKGYAEKEGDARTFHPKLRPPVRNEELEIDEKTGMKKYMATENQGWDTSTAFIRRTFRSCIEAGRRAQGREGTDLYEAYRLLGTGLHTMEDLLAHSNWCEIALRKLGHQEVFCHVGDRVSINTPNGRAPPLVTGTFGSADFLHSLLGEAGDKLSQASVTDLSAKMNDVNQGGGSKKSDISGLKDILGKFGGGDDNKLNKGEEIKQQSQGYNFDPDNIAPPEVQKQLLDILKWHDDVMRDIIKRIEMVPGLTNLLEEFSNALNEYIYTILAPYLGPILTQATGVLDEGSKAVIDNDDQYEVFDNPNAHDPSHSLLSKDHFGLILNEPAGKIAQVVVEHSVNLIVKAWSDDGNPDDAINQILEAFHHPYYASGRSDIQNKMFDHMQRWIGGMGSEATEIIKSLTKDSVRNHKNKRKGLEDTEEPGYGGCGHGPRKPTQSIGGVAGGYGGSKPTKAYDNKGSFYTGAPSTTSGYGNTQSQTGGRADSSNTYGQSGGYASQHRDDDNNSGSGRGGYGGGQKKYDNDSYGSTRRGDDVGGGVHGSSGYTSQQQTSYGQKRDDDSSHGNTGYGTQKTHDTPYGGGGYGSQKRDESPSYGGGYGSQKRDDTPSYGGGRKTDDTPSYGGGYGSQKRDETPLYGANRRTDDTPSYGGGYSSQKRDETPSYGGGYGNQKRDDNDDDKHGSGYGRRKDDNDDDKRGSGGYGQRRRDDDDDNHGSRRGEHDSHGRGGYGGQTQAAYGSSGHTASYGQSDTSGAYSGSKYGKKDDDDDDDDDDKKKKKYGGGHDDDNNYGRKKAKDDSDDDDRKKSYGQSSHGQSYGQSGTSGYAPSYGGSENTYGVERMNIGGGRDGRGRDDDSNDDKKRRNKHGGY